jgi:hypothetical protein
LVAAGFGSEQGHCVVGDEIPVHEILERAVCDRDGGRMRASAFNTAYAMQIDRLSRHAEDVSK